MKLNMIIRVISNCVRIFLQILLRRKKRVIRISEGGKRERVEKIKKRNLKVIHFNIQISYFYEQLSKDQLYYFLYKVSKNPQRSLAFLPVKIWGFQPFLLEY